MTDLLFAAVTVLLVVAYHAFMHSRLQRDPFFTVHALNKLAREAWVESVMVQRGPDVLAVQTLRNSVMASSFMASTVILLMIGALSVAASSENARTILHALNIAGGTDDATAAWKVLCLLADFFAAFFFFAMAVRFYNHVGYMVGISPERSESAISPALVVAYLNRAGTFYFFGMRAFFYAVPLVFWLFGPSFMLGAAIVLILALYPLDRAPSTSLGQPNAAAAKGAPKVLASAADRRPPMR